MFLRIKRLSPVCFLATGVAFENEKKIDPSTYHQNYIDKLTYDSLTPWERVKEIFRFENRQRVNDDYTWIANHTLMATMVGAMYGGFTSGQKAFQDFIHNNDASKFANPYDAKRTLHNKMVLGMFKGALKFGPKFGILVGIYALTTTCTAVYRGKNGILEHSIAGFTMGTLFRFNYGLRGMIVGGATGLLFATIYGTGIFFLTKMAGINLEQIRRENYNMYTWSDRMGRKISEKGNIDNMDPLEKEKFLRTQHLPIGLDILPDSPEGSK